MGTGGTKSAAKSWRQQATSSSARQVILQGSLAMPIKWGTSADTMMGGVMDQDGVASRRGLLKSEKTRTCGIDGQTGCLVVSRRGRLCGVCGSKITADELIRCQNDRFNGSGPHEDRFVARGARIVLNEQFEPVGLCRSRPEISRLA